MNDNLKSALEALLKEIIPFDKAREDEQKQFNILKSIRSSNDEVRLHSHFIASLLDPDAPHGLNKEPLKLFLNKIGVPENIADDEGLSVQPNYNDKREYKEMDILVRTNNYAVLIENKVFAKDSNNAKDGEEKDDKYILQPKRKGQIERYYARLVKPEYKGHGHFEEKKVYVRYLTVDGHLASKDSTGENRDINDHLKFKELPEKVIGITYGTHILNWLRELLSIEKINPSVKVIIEQYKMAVEELANVVKERENIVQKIGNLSLEERKALSTLFRNEKDICWHIADLFFQDLYKMVIDSGNSLWMKKDDKENVEVKDIYVSMPPILDDTVGPKGGKSTVNFYFSKTDKSPALVLDKGILKIDDKVKIDFNDLSSHNTINISEKEYREELVLQVFNEMQGK